MSDVGCSSGIVALENASCGLSKPGLVGRWRCLPHSEERIDLETTSTIHQAGRRGAGWTSDVYGPDDERNQASTDTIGGVPVAVNDLNDHPQASGGPEDN